MHVRSQFATGTSSPSAGSRTFASSHGNLPWSRRCRNCATPKSRSWFYPSVAVRRHLEFTHTHTGNRRASLVQKRNHMPALGNGTLETGVESIAGEEGEDVWLVCELMIMVIIVHDGLKASDAADGLCRPRSGELVSWWAELLDCRAYSTW